MVDALERHPAVHAVLNWVPVLLDQLDDVAAGKQDALQVRTRQVLADGSVAGTKALLHELELALGPRARAEYEGLLDRRTDSDVDPRAALRQSTLAFLVAWSGARLQRAPRLAALRGRVLEATDEDLTEIEALQVAEVRGLLPRLRALEARGQVELTATPYHHPILPLLCELDSRAHPADPGEPPFRLSVPQDAADHVERALAAHARRFGARAAGMWPAEGAISEAALAIFADAGVRWVASDQAVLERSLGAKATGPGAHTRWYRRNTARGPLAILFRDHDLSDRIGFQYAAKSPVEAVDDFLRGLRERLRPGTPRSSVLVALDGENPWEHYADAGRPFLDELYGRIAAEPWLRTITPRQRLETDAVELRALDRVVGGSWIDGTFATWAGHPEKLRAWRWLHEVRRAAGDDHRLAELPEALAEHLRVLESSDWFWWLGDDHRSAFAEVFDRLFLGRAKAVLALTGREDLELPRRLREARSDLEADREPLEWIAPRGQPSDRLQWASAGVFELRGDEASMSRARAGNVLRFGFEWADGAAILHLRLEGDRWRSPPTEDRLSSELPVARLRRKGEGEERTIDVCLEPSLSTPGVLECRTRIEAPSPDRVPSLTLVLEGGGLGRWPGTGSARIPAPGQNRVGGYGFVES